ncbi:hypothetical protein OUY22_20400 [Nonomuraea sp. MCN248]|uniref:Uncharacterized protein n=1 Tax=Nonomuraea corallina TaxID=2989783 RepID=A0ABT4SEZ8_9ACTN|nr:hypothetical protein [Nonomuraea corallina]MDA0635788.1 hypothetical protein [Nonomuraea corallina]
MDIPPIVCDMSAARDTPQQRLAEYGRLFGRALTARERTAGGVRFRFRADGPDGPDGLEEWVRDLAAREKACCAFFSSEVTASAGEVVWDLTVPADEMAEAILEEFFQLPETAAAGPDEPLRRLADRGLRFV